MAYDYFVDKNKDGSKTYTTVYTAPGVQIKKKVTVMDIDDDDDYDNVCDRITVKKVDKKCDKKCCKSDKSDIYDIISEISDLDESTTEALIRIARECAETRKANKSKSRASEIRAIFDKYEEDDIKGLADEINDILIKPENFEKILALLMEMYKNKE